MATKISFKRISLGFVEKKYPVLFETVNSIEGLNQKQKEQVAGLAIEVMMKCNGTPDLFEDDIDDLFMQEEDFE